jgi:DNA (cytosine-5)-methyltransferase 1
VKPRLLDLFCGAGGAAMGYHRAGFDVVGVDIAPQPNYPFPFVQADGLAPPFQLDGFDAIHASPPCQRWTVGAPGRALGDKHPDLLTPTRDLLRATGLPYVIENVVGAPMPDAFLLCGATFGLPVMRHRLFEVYPKIDLVPSLCHQTRWGRAVDHGPGFYSYGHGKWRDAWREHVVPVVWPWMTLEEAGQAIPPAYTEFIGGQLLAALEQAA